MPPVISKKPASFKSMGSIVKSLPPPAVDDRVTGLFSMEGASAAMKLVDFDQEELITNLISLMRSPDPDIALRSTKVFWDISKDIVTYNGQLASQTLTQESTTNGVTHRRTTTITTLAGSPTPSYTSGAFSAPVTRAPKALDASPVPSLGGSFQPQPEPVRNAALSGDGEAPQEHG